MRLLGPYIFLLVGVLVGLATTYMFRNPMRIPPNVLLGVVGSFFGLWLRDVLDLRLGGNMTGALIAATCGAVLLTVAVNIVLNRMHTD